MSKYELMDIDELGDLFSDYHKDVHGFRPRYVDMKDKTALIAALQRLDEYMDWRKMTPAGRNQLRMDGWVIRDFEKEDGWDQDAYDAEQEQIRMSYEQMTLC